MSERIRPIWAEENDTGVASAWEIPDMAGNRRDEATEPAPEMPSVEEIERMQAEARAEAAREGRREGYEKGFAEGRQAGLDQGQAEIKRRAGELQALLDSLQAPAAEMDAEVEQGLAELALAVARQVIRREIVTQHGEIVGVVREAVAELPLDNREVRLRVHPDDAAVLRDAGVEGEWRIVEDPSVNRGGCLVDSGASHVDARLETRIANVAASLLGDGRDGDTAAEGGADPAGEADDD
ncbi:MULTISPECIES: flagellar assembly protein FliH [Arhodomonas]|uniref:FliH/SctL family protein n=1 Tax=Arhodomonas TaxID=2368 RepID=UPI00036395DA|nr:flagellar assembly protein FliH [Arhodomonas aquaeolei]